MVSTSDDGSVFVDSFEDDSTVGLAVGVADDFPFPTGTSGQYVRITGVLLVDQWLSISEVRQLDGWRLGERSMGFTGLAAGGGHFLLQLDAS